LAWRYDWRVSLREEKKRATRTAIADAALGLFLARGFDAVTVAEVAAAARVAVNTVFNYFPTKEDLFFDRQDAVVGRLARAVDERRPGESVVACVRRALLEAVARREPTLGLNPEARAFWGVIDGSPALQARLRLMAELTEAALAERIGDPLLAAAVAGVDRAIHGEIRRRVLAGADPAAEELVKRGFSILAEGA
jgi:AcrR family transcriptional regulator